MLRSYNLPTRELLWDLLRGSTPTAHLGAQCLRTALARHNTETTYVVPGDWPPLDGRGWFHDGIAPDAGTDVEYLIDGPMTFRAMIEAMETAVAAGHFIVLLGWSLDHAFDLSGGETPGGRTFLQIVEERAKLGVSVRVLLWDNTEMGDMNSNASIALNELRTGQNLDVYCNLDDNTKGYVSSVLASWVGGKPGVHSYGAHHQKILLVHGREGLIGFCGGLDLHWNRLPNGGWSEGSLHDVHLRVTGDAAKKLLEIAEARWAAAEDDDNPPSPSKISLPNTTPPESVGASHLARVVQTVGNPDISKRCANSLWPSIQAAIRRASQFIYIEDQYLMSVDLVAELVDAAKRVKHVTILLPPLFGTELGVAKRRQFAMRQLVRLGGSDVRKKIGIFEATKPKHKVVHSKLFVFDDEYAIIGSANANNRGYFLDSEADICVAEREWKSPVGLRGGDWSVVEANFARRLRLELWEEHLQLPAEELFDGVAARVHWEFLPELAQVATYQSLNLRKCVLPGTHATFLGGKLGPDDVKPWWDAPYAEWEPYGAAEDSYVDPKD